MALGGAKQASADDGAQSPLRAALRACRVHFIFVAIFSAALNILYLAPSLYMLQVYDRVLVTGGVLTLIFLTLVLLASLATLAFLDATRTRLLAAASRRLERLLAPLILAAPFQRAPRAGERIAQPIRSFDVVRQAVAGPAVLALVDAPWTPLYAVIAFIIHPWLGLLAIGGGAALLALAALNELALRRAMRGNEDAGERMYALQAGDSIHGATARALGMHGNLMDRQIEARSGFGDAHDKAARRGAVFTSSTKFLRLALQSAALGLGALLAVRQEISAGAVIAASILVARALAPLEQVVGAWRQFGQAAQALKTVRGALAELEPDRDYTELPPVRGTITVERASVVAPANDRYILHDITFRVSPGEIIGVLGPSGGGKSTLMRTIVGAIALHEGTVRIDGAQLSDWRPEKLGRFIGYLPQEVALFAGSIAENIARFEPREGGESDRLAVDAAVKAGVHDMILRLPRGYDTEIGIEGRGLSAGQAQRVALARALYRDPMLIVLDEPNSHVDAEGEAALINALKTAQARGAAVIVVAHRAGFMSIADKLLVIRDGRLDAFGPRDQIVAKLAAAGAQRPMISPQQDAAGRRS